MKTTQQALTAATKKERRSIGVGVLASIQPTCMHLSAPGFLARAADAQVWIGTDGHSWQAQIGRSGMGTVLVDGAGRTLDSAMRRALRAWAEKGRRG